MIMRPVSVSRSSDYFQDGIPFYINRTYESTHKNEHRHEFVEISYVAEGSAVHYIGASSKRVSRGDLFYIPAGTSHYFRLPSPQTREPFVVYNCLLTEETLQRLLEVHEADEAVSGLFLPGPGPGHYVAVRDATASMEPYFHLLHLEFHERRSGYVLAMRSLVERILIDLYRLVRETNDRPGTAKPFPELLLKLRHHVRHPMRLTEAAACTGLGARHFARRFKEATGMTYSEYIRKLRIDTACGLLRTTTRKVKEIADLVGYEDMQSFQRTFRAVMSVTPSGYRDGRG